MAHGVYEKMCRASYPDIKSVKDIPEYNIWRSRYEGLGKPPLKSLEELKAIWAQRQELKRKRREMRENGALSHRGTTDYVFFDPTGVFDDELKEVRKLYKSEGWRGHPQKALAEADVMYRHGYYTLEDYWALRERTINVWKGSCCEDAPIPSYSRDIEDEDDDTNY